VFLTNETLIMPALLYALFLPRLAEIGHTMDVMREQGKPADSRTLFGQISLENSSEPLPESSLALAVDVLSVSAAR
jgi:hypothetical protein